LARRSIARAATISARDRRPEGTRSGTFVDLDNDALEDLGGVFGVIGGDIQKRPQA